MILSCGTITAVALELVKELKSCALYSFHTVKPLNTQFLKEIFNQYERVITIEEHSLIGGFGSAVAEWAVDNRVDTKNLVRFGTKDEFLHGANDYSLGAKSLGLGLEDLRSKINT